MHFAPTKIEYFLDKRTNRATLPALYLDRYIVIFNNDFLHQPIKVSSSPPLASLREHKATLYTLADPGRDTGTRDHLENIEKLLSWADFHFAMCIMVEFTIMSLSLVWP